MSEDHIRQVIAETAALRDRLRAELTALDRGRRAVVDALREADAAHERWRKLLEQELEDLGAPDSADWWKSGDSEPDWQG